VIEQKIQIIRKIVVIGKFNNESSKLIIIVIEIVMIGKFNKESKFSETKKKPRLAETVPALLRIVFSHHENCSIIVSSSILSKLTSVCIQSVEGLLRQTLRK